jgi:dienelactone hydrolase
VVGLAEYAEHRTPLADVRRFRDCLDRHDKSYTIKVYPGVPHGWLNDTMPGRMLGRSSRRGPKVKGQSAPFPLSPQDKGVKDSY